MRSRATDVTPVVLVAEQLRRAVPGGIGTYVRALVGALGVLGDLPIPSIELFASRPSRRARAASTGACVEGDPVRALGLPLRTAPFGPRLASVLWGQGQGGIPGRPALVHALSFSVPPTTAPLVVTVHDLAFRVVPGAFTARGRRWHELVLRRVADHAARLVVPSRAVFEELMSAGLGIEPERVRVIPEGADHLADEDLLATTELLGCHGVAGPFVLVVGTLEPRKNLTRVVEAFTMAQSAGLADYTLVVCGPPGWKTELGDAPGVATIGRVPDPVLAGLYRNAEMVVYAPLYEGFGLPVVEAMAKGAVVVSSNVPSASAGTFVVDPLDVGSIAEGIYRCCVDDELRRTLRTAGREHVAGLTWERTARAHVELWQELVGR